MADRRVPPLRRADRPSARICGTTRVHLVGGEVGAGWLGGGSHHSLCGMVADYPTLLIPSLPLCEVCRAKADRANLDEGVRRDG